MTQGAALESRKRYWWKVRIWDDRQQPSPWSEPAFWSMGLLQPADWRQAQWIGLDVADPDQLALPDFKAAKWLWFPEGNPAVDAPIESRFFRRLVSLPADRKIRRAQCFLAGDDQCVLYVNGEPAGMSRGHHNQSVADIAGLLRPARICWPSLPPTNRLTSNRIRPAGSAP